MNSEPLSLSMDIVVDDAVLEDTLDCPGNATGLVTFTHGNGSSRFNPRNRYVADQLHATGPSTPPFDPLSAKEASHASCRFDTALLAHRLQGATHTVGSVARERSSRLGYFGAGTGATTAILAASELDGAYTIETMVGRGGHPDLAGQRALVRLTCSTLLIVGATDSGVLDLSR